MKKLLVVPALFVSSLLWAQDLTTVQSGEKVIVDNDKIKVVEIDGLVLVVKQAKAPGLLSGLAPGAA